MKKNHWKLFALCYCIISIFMVFYFNGAGKEADSINHFLYAQYAPFHPELYVNHWAKPLFTFLASPFAQFGLIGIKLFNILCVFGASYFTFKIVSKLRFKQAVLAPIFYFSFPISFVTTFSGLTEPLSAFMLIGSIYLFQHKKYLTCALLISLTPFVRSEGLIFLAVFAFFFIYLKNWKALALLSFGHIVYSMIGYFHYQEIFWVFTKIPYAHLSSHYGSGSLFHFAEKLNYLMGIPLLVFFILGTIRILAGWKRMRIASRLVMILFLSFFIAHSLFWYLEIFNSMGLKRVFAAITPLMAIIALFGFDLFNKMIVDSSRKGLMAISLLLIFVFPFTSNPAAVDWNDLNLTDAQENARSVAAYLKEKGEVNNRFIYTDPYLSYALKVDPFDGEKHQILAQNEGIVSPTLKSGDLIIWDNWHSVVDYGVSPDMLSNLEFIEGFSQEKSIYKIYRKE
ncbi:hypothetical protein OAD50_03030 [Vicingaceae bacterium]|nr:hypothetical protein [Vicingaceae bacterium]